MSMNPDGNETHMTLEDFETVFAEDFPPLTDAEYALIVHSYLGTFVFQVIVTPF